MDSSATDASRRLHLLGSHLAASPAVAEELSSEASRSQTSPDDIVIVDAIRTPITKAKRA
ncbi:unnamed protein product, partial [Choristocarpus tenellus]